MSILFNSNSSIRQEFVSHCDGNFHEAPWAVTQIKKLGLGL
jgi:hypothetical protein